MSNRSSNLCCIIWTRPYGIFEDFKFVHSRAVMDFKKIISIIFVIICLFVFVFVFLHVLDYLRGE